MRYRGRYYGVYHANADPEWKGPWTTCLAASDDLVRWEKYPGNPVIRSDDSSGILVDDGQRLRLLHDAPRGQALAAARRARSPIDRSGPVQGRDQRPFRGSGSRASSHTRSS